MQGSYTNPNYPRSRGLTTPIVHVDINGRVIKRNTTTTTIAKKNNNNNNDNNNDNTCSMCLEFCADSCVNLCGNFVSRCCTLFFRAILR